MPDFFNELQTWWQKLGPQMQTAIQIGCVLFLGLVAGYFLGAMVVRTLRAYKFDDALRLPGSGDGEGGGITPTVIGGLLVRLTVWAGAAWWLARQHGRTDLSDALGVIISRTWALATVLVASLAVGGVLARRIADALAPKGAEPSRNGPAASRGVAGAVGAGVYALVLLIVLLIASDVFNWPLTRSSTLALWQLAHNLLIAGACLLIGSLGARWARELVSTDAATPEKRAGQYTALGIVAASSVLALAVLLSSAGVVFGLAALVILGFLVWLVRGYLPDVLAGLQLRAHSVREVWFDGAAWTVTDVGFLTSGVCRGGEVHRVQNRLVIQARMQGAPAEAAQR